ncbi:SDR family oxidoreductase [Catenulispora sp. MAP5-51]|uniref:SDR family oxidoreductase n=2 Tax=unclassified Catenulispora TaxID=414885 RepID=UPI0035192886
MLHFMAVRTYMVTGASSGIGRACVDELVRIGARVWATVRSDSDEKALLRDHPAGVRVLRMDLSDPESVSAAAQQVVADGPLDGLVNNAAMPMPWPLEHTPLDAFRRQLEINLTGHLAVTQAVLPALRLAARQSGTARIVQVGSIVGRIAGTIHGPYQISKFGVVGLTDSLRAELAPFGIKVVLIEPGAVATQVWSKMAASFAELEETLPDAAREQYADQITAARTSAKRTEHRGLPPSRPAQVIVKALTARYPRPRYVVGLDAHLGALAARLPDRVRYWLTAARA